MAKKKDLSEHLELNQNQKEKNILEIKLIETNPIINMSYLFCEDISKWDTKNVINISSMFYFLIL